MTEHKVSTDALATLGTIIDESQKRDAIHLAVIPMVAQYAMRFGSHVGANGCPSKIGEGVGVVDPFLPSGVKAGERFWCVLYPRTITSLRHVWSHPQFEEEASSPARPGGASEAWLRSLADSLDVTYNQLIAGADDWVAGQRAGDRWGSYLVGGDAMEGASTPTEFWTHYEVVTGNKVAEAHRGSFFSCSC